LTERFYDSLIKTANSFYALNELVELMIQWLFHNSFQSVFLNNF